jgi:uncharacterized membrane protein YhaH (DUF805 family)
MAKKQSNKLDVNPGWLGFILWNSIVSLVIFIVISFYGYTTRTGPQAGAIYVLAFFLPLFLVSISTVIYCIRRIKAKQKTKSGIVLEIMLILFSSFGIMLSVLMLLAVLLVPMPARPVCADKQCFISLAQKCTGASIVIDEDYGNVNYTVTDKCVFTKKIVRLKEAGELANIVDGASLTCDYEQGKFDERWVKTMIYGLEPCDGYLKQLIGGLMIFT